VNKKDKARDSYYRRTYGISLADYNHILNKQNHKCAVCGKHETQTKGHLHVDHDHKTMEVRGLLCAYCNLRVIGRHRDPEVFANAAEYLRSGHTGWFVPVRKRRKRRKRKKKIV
jgi:hypothetical protein